MEVSTHDVVDGGGADVELDGGHGRRWERLSYLDASLRTEWFVYACLCVNLVRDFSSYTSSQPSLILPTRPSWIQQNWPNCRRRLRPTGLVSKFWLSMPAA